MPPEPNQLVPFSDAPGTGDSLTLFPHSFDVPDLQTQKPLPMLKVLAVGSIGLLLLISFLALGFGPK